MKIAVVGTGPYPTEPGAAPTGPAIRTRQFAEPLAAAGHEVSLVLSQEEPAGSDIAGMKQTIRLAWADLMQPAQVMARLRRDGINAIFGVGSMSPVASAVRVARRLAIPCWADFFGDPMAELHALQTATDGSTLARQTARDHVWKMFREALSLADRVSTVSQRQRHAVLGQWALLGRLVDEQVSSQVHAIPCAIPSSWANATETPPLPERPELQALEGRRFVLFAGTWNVWLDGATMGRALRLALERDPDLLFVCAATGEGNGVRSAVMEGLPASQVVAPREMPPGTEAALMARAGACLSLDRLVPEAELGSRNRLLAMVRWGARPVVNPVSEVEEQLADADLAEDVPVGDAEAAAEGIRLACNRTAEARENDRMRGLVWLHGVTFDATMRGPLAWLAAGAPKAPAAGYNGLIERWSAVPESWDAKPGSPKGFRRFLRGK